MWRKTCLDQFLVMCECNVDVGANHAMCECDAVQCSVVLDCAPHVELRMMCVQGLWHLIGVSVRCHGARLLVAL